MEYFTTDVVVERPNIRQMDEMVLSKCIFKKQRDGFGETDL